MTNYVTTFIEHGFYLLLSQQSYLPDIAKCTHQKLINKPGKADATLCESHGFVTLKAMIHDSSVSDGAIPASDQFEGSKADMPGYNCSAQCFEEWYAAHLTTFITQSSRL